MTLYIVYNATLSLQSRAMHLMTHIAWPLLLCIGFGTAGIPDLEQQPIQLPTEDSVFDPGFDIFVEDILRELHIPGLSLAVVDKGKITSKGYGFAVLPDQGSTADTQYFAGSTTKAFTAAAAALLVHDNDKYPSVKWTTPINQLIRADFVLEDEYATSHTTIEDALSHRTGLPRHDLVLGQANDRPSTVVQRMRYLPMTAQPRTQWQYCNMMYGVVTDLIQTVTGTQLEAFLRDNFWLPLGMLSTTMKIPSDGPERSRLARGYYWNSSTDEQPTPTDDGNYIPDVYLNLLGTAGDGAIISTVNDYALWIKALMNASGDEESWNSSSPITRDVYHDLVTPRAIIPEAKVQRNSKILSPLLYALGWITTQIAGVELLTHSGGVTGFGTQLYMLPGLSYGMVTMGNTAASSNDAGATIAAQLLLGKLNLTAETTGLASSMQQGLINAQRAGRRSPIRKHRQQQSSSGLERQHAPTRHQPLPLPLSSFVGLYSHPAYGTMNLTISTSPTPPSSPPKPAHVLEVLFYREAVTKEVLTHISGTLFEARTFEPHGLGDVVTGEGIVWEDLGDEDGTAYASFELGIDGKAVERAGVEFEPEMVDMARRKGERFWREGMVWFERVRETP